MSSTHRRRDSTRLWRRVGGVYRALYVGNVTSLLLCFLLYCLLCGLSLMPQPDVDTLLVNEYGGIIRYTA